MQRVGSLEAQPSLVHSNTAPTSILELQSSRRSITMNRSPRVVGCRVLHRRTVFQDVFRSRIELNVILFVASLLEVLPHIAASCNTFESERGSLCLAIRRRIYHMRSSHLTSSRPTEQALHFKLRQPFMPQPMCSRDESHRTLFRLYGRVRMLTEIGRASCRERV